MNVVLLGGTKALRSRLEHVVRFGKRELFPSIRKVHIEVEICRNLSKKKVPYDAELKVPYAEQGNFRWFLIKVDRFLTEKQMIYSTLHEMVHAKQYIMGELRSIPGWLSEEYWVPDGLPDADYPGVDKMSWKAYRALPQEEEANRLEKILGKKYLKENKLMAP